MPHRLKVYMRGTQRPKRIILCRHGQGHGYAHTSGTDIDGKIHCSDLPEVGFAPPSLPAWKTSEPPPPPPPHVRILTVAPLLSHSHLQMRRPLTNKGRNQSLTMGARVKTLVGQESVRSYVSPYLTCEAVVRILWWLL